MDGMHCFIDSTSVLVKIISVSLYDCRTVYFINSVTIILMVTVFIYGQHRTDVK